MRDHQLRPGGSVRLRDAGVIYAVIEGTTHINTLRLDELDRKLPGSQAPFWASSAGPRSFRDISFRLGFVVIDRVPR
ncbi:hypothetical protein ATY76_14320 [Rhizobium sp. R339]|nr:hypothetical protein ATY76_14320 [Rhizobium sp. R339]